jgi:phosphoglycerate dehydrogenase-like enzyme
MTSSAPIHVLCTRNFTPAQCERLRAASPRIVIKQRAAASRAELMQVLSPEVEVLFGTFAPDSIAELPQLRWFQSRSAGMNSVVGTPVWSTPEILVTNSSGVHGPSIAEYTVGMMIALARDFRGLLSFQERSCWPMSPKNHVQQFPGRELRGSTVLIVGYGSIGREIGRQCHALGLRVIAIKRDPTRLADSGFALPGTGDPTGSIPERFLGPGELNEALPEAEYVVLASASTAENQDLIGDAQLRRMRSDAFIVNVGRGDLIDETALIAALKERRIAGAALDVFAREPLAADSPLWLLDNVILSPHVSGITPRYDDHMAALFSENLRRYALGEPLLNLVDRALGY